MRFIEVLLGIILFPLMLVLGLICGLVRVYSSFHNAFWTTIYQEEHL